VEGVEVEEVVLGEEVEEASLQVEEVGVDHLEGVVGREVVEVVEVEGEVGGEWEEGRKLLLNHTDMRVCLLPEEKKMLW